MTAYKESGKRGPKPPPGWVRIKNQHYFTRLSPQVIIECKRVKGIDPPWCFYLTVDAQGISARTLIGRSDNKPSTVETTKAWIQTAVEYVEQQKLYLQIISEASERAPAKIAELDTPPVPKGGSFRAHQMAIEMEQQTLKDGGEKWEN